MRKKRHWVNKPLRARRRIAPHLLAFLAKRPSIGRFRVDLTMDNYTLRNLRINWQGGMPALSAKRTALQDVFQFDQSITLGRNEFVEIRNQEYTDIYERVNENNITRIKHSRLTRPPGNRRFVYEARCEVNPVPPFLQPGEMSTNPLLTGERKPGLLRVGISIERNNPFFADIGMPYANNYFPINPAETDNPEPDNTSLTIKPYT